MIAGEALPPASVGAAANRRSRDALFDLLLDLACISGMVLAIRAFLLKPFWLDETFTAGAASAGSLSDLFVRWLGPDVHPPLHYLVEYALVHLFGPHIWLLRLPSLVAFAATLLTLRRFGPAIIGARAARLAGATIAVMPAVLDHAGEARGYALLMALATGTTLAFLVVRQNTHAQAMRRFVVLALLLSFTHYFGALLAGALFAALLTRTRGSRHATVLAGAAVYGLAFAPWLVWHGLRLATLVQGPFWIPPMPLATAVETAVLAAGGNVLTLVIWAIAAGMVTLRQPRVGGLGGVAELLAVVCLGIVVALLVNLLKPLIVDRYFLAFLPAVTIAGAMLVSKLPSPPQKLLMLPMLILMLLADIAPVPPDTALSWHGAAARIMAAKVHTVLLIYDEPFIPAFDEDNLAAMAGTFFRDAGYPVRIVARRSAADGTLALTGLPPLPGAAILKIDGEVAGYKAHHLTAPRLGRLATMSCDPPRSAAPHLCLPVR